MIKIHRVKTITPGEQLMLMRRRKGLTQMDLAKQINLSQMSISNYENDVRNIPVGMFLTWFTIKPKDFTKAENLRMFRKRLQLTIKQMAKKMLISNVTYMKMEAGEHHNYLQN